MQVARESRHTFNDTEDDPYELLQPLVASE